MSRPVIAVTTYAEPSRWGAWNERAVVLHECYSNALRLAGANVILLPPDPADTEILDVVDGLVLSGGADVDPRRYGATAHQTTDAPRMDRDAAEIALYLDARRRDLPVLGICRGLQVMAVAHGGTLHQNLPDLELGVSHRRSPGTFDIHPARFAEGSRIARIYGRTEMNVNSSHHQAIDQPGTLTVTGWASDDTVEACEDQEATFIVGVQWHPERPDRMDDMALFSAFVTAARERRMQPAPLPIS